jgi:ubiquinone/menaquinone biosynthesis C-methylase UbiE
VLTGIARFLRPALALLALFLALGFVIVVYDGIHTLEQLTTIEAERDQWQRPNEIISALNLNEGSTVVDLGCGAGYFALKLSRVVNSGGTVLAVDIRRLPLRFLWIRALLRREHNVRTLLGQPNNSHLPTNAVNAVLIANTYHELDYRSEILRQISRSLVADGRLVIVDPLQTEHGVLSPRSVGDELRTSGFEILSREDHFLDQPGRGVWWLIIARKRDR